MSAYKALAMDFGASSGRGIIGTFDGDKLTLSEVHRFANNSVELAGRLTWDAPALYMEILNALSKCASLGGVSSIGIDTWGVDYGYIDKNGHLLSNPVHYRDSRCDNIQREVFSIVPWEELYGVTGIQNLQFNTIYQLYCDVTRDPHIVTAADKMLFMPDLFFYFLTGSIGCEYTIASTGAILDAKTRTIARDILHKLGIKDTLFTPITEPGADAVPLKDKVAAAVGLSGVRAIRCASHDTASAVLSVPAKDKNFAYISSGTWSLLGTELTSPLISDASRNAGFTNEGGAGGTIRFLKNIAGLWLEQESRRQWEREGKKYSYDELSELAMASKPLKFIIDPDDARFTAPGDMPKRIAEFCRETGQGTPETPGEIVRCIFDSLALRYRYTLTEVKSLTGQDFPHIHIVGGGVREEPLSRLAADATGTPVVAGPVEATATGNIAVQLIAAGELKDIAEAREVISRSFETKIYEPDKSTSGAWDDAYARFLDIIKRR